MLKSFICKTHKYRHTFILDDPFPDPVGLEFPENSPLRKFPPQETIQVEKKKENYNKIDI